VARDLLGKVLCRRLADGTVVRARIVETEAYRGVDDAASHAYGGPTPRSAIMFGPPGYAYVYLIYGMWCCLNVVTGDDGVASAVLVRAAHVPGDARAAAGPGRLCRALAISRADNGADLARGRALWLADDGFMPATVSTGPRIGVDYAGAWARKPWRFWVTQDAAVSR
jgi:DNA-3-methyladenine glycosylase